MSFLFITSLELSNVTNDAEQQETLSFIRASINTFKHTERHTVWVSGCGFRVCQPVHENGMLENTLSEELV